MTQVLRKSRVAVSPELSGNGSVHRAAPSRGLRRLHLDARYLGPALITLILLAGHLSFGILESFTRTLAAVVTSIAAEVVLGLYLRGRVPHLAGAYVSGISVGILIRSTFYWPFILCALLSITSKYVLRYGDRHIWNPSNFGICVMFFLAPFAVAPLSVQWGNNLSAMLVIWVLGAVIVSRVRRFHISLTYVVCYVLFSGVRAFVTGDPFLSELAPLTGPMYQLFVLFMITDPRTTVSTTRGRIAVAAAIAFVEMFLRLAGSVYAPFYALFLVGPPAFILDQFLQARRKHNPQALPVVT